MYDVSVRSINIDDRPTNVRPTTDLTFWKISNLIHIMYVRPLYFALGHCTSLLTLLGDEHFARGTVASRPTVLRERNERAALEK